MDTMTIKIHEDGQLEIKTSAISQGNHMSADQLVLEVEKLMGGKMNIEKDPLAQAHAHMHKHGVHHAHNH